MLQNGVDPKAFGADMESTTAPGPFSNRFRATSFAVISEADWPAFGIIGAPPHLVDCRGDTLLAFGSLLAALFVPHRLLHIGGAFA